MHPILSKIHQLGPAVVITPVDFKMMILREAAKEHVFLDVIWYTRAQFISSLTYQETPLILAKATRHLGVIPEIASDMLQYMPYVDEDDTYETKRLRLLQSLRKDLLTMNALDRNTAGKTRLEKRRIALFGYPHPDRFFMGILSSLKGATSVLSLDGVIIRKDSITVDSYKTDIDEIIALAEAICHLIDHGVLPENIKIHAPDADDFPLITLVFKRFNLIPNFKTANTLGSLAMSDVVSSDIFSGKTMDDDLAMLHARLMKLAASSEDTAFLAKTMFDVCQKYALMPGRLFDYRDLLAYEFKNTYLPVRHHDRGIMINDLLETDIGEDDHVFMIKANAGAIPKTIKNNAFLDDTELEILGIETSVQKNMLEKARLLSVINNTKYLHMSYRETNGSEELYPTPLIDEISRTKTSRVPSSDHLFSYSKSQDLLSLAKHLDAYISYGISSPLLKRLYGGLRNDLLEPYDNSFSGLNFQTTTALLQNANPMSYSKLNAYFECPFKFLMAHLVKLDPFEGDTLSLSLGNFFHDVLKDYLLLPDSIDDLRISLNQRLDDFITSSDQTLIDHDRFYLRNALTQLMEVVLWIKAIDQDSAFTVDATEEKVELPLPGTHITTLVGKIDKIMTATTTGHTFYVVDYKTGNARHPLDYVRAGLDAQLMFYLLFLSRVHSNPTFGGFYYQNIHSGILKAKDGKSYLELLRQEWRLDGYSINNNTLVAMIDANYKDRNTFARYRVTNDGVPYKNAWVYHHENLVKAIDSFEELINDTIEKIEAGDFPIRPKYLNGDISQRPGCQFCTFKDVCYVKINNFENVLKENPLQESESEDSEDAS